MSEQIIKKPTIEDLYFETFKKHLYVFVCESFSACDSFALPILNAESDKHLIKHFERNVNLVTEFLGGEDIDDLNYEIDNLRDEISGLKCEIDELEDGFDLGFNAKTKTINDDYKIEHFIKYKNEYSEWELEELLKNGKKYLEQSK